MKKKALLVLSVLLFSVSYATEVGKVSIPPAAGQKVPVTAKTAKTPMTKATDGPQILEFAASPDAILEGDTTTLRWRVEPGPGGSPVESLEIRDGTPASPGGRIYARLLLSGEYPSGRIYTGGVGRARFTLKVVDRAGRSASRTAEIVTGSPESFIAGLSGFALNLETIVDGARRDHIATIGFDNGSRISAGNVMVYLYQAYSPLMLGVDIPDGYLAGSLNGVNIVPGHNEFRIGAALRSTSPATGDRRGLGKLVLIVAKEYSPGVIERILIRGLYDLVETRDAGGSVYSVRLIKIG